MSLESQSNTGSTPLLHLPFFSFLDDRGRADVQYPRRIANPTGVHGHVDDLALHCRRLAMVAIVQQESTTRTALRSAAVPLLALPGLAMADYVSALTVGTVQDLDNHDATQLPWGSCASETLNEDSLSTPLRHLPMMNSPSVGRKPAAVRTKGTSRSALYQRLAARRGKQ